jgi:hypothetical protein
MAKPDALRTSLDQRQVDRKAGRDKQYMESVLRRIGPAQPEAATVFEAPEPTTKATPAVGTPTFDRVKPVKHPKQKVEVTGATEFRQLSKKQKRGKAKAAKLTGESLGDQLKWDDEPTEEADLALAPDPAAGYMKGNYALFRRQMDSDHAVYFFATELPEDADQTRVPSGYEVRLTSETNLPYIARRGSTQNATMPVRAKDRDEAIEIAARRGVGGINGA